MSPALSAKSVSVRRGSRDLLADVSLDLAPGALTAIVGPNGAGKSTLLKLLAGEIAPSAGTVTLDGKSLAGYRPWDLAARRAVMPQAARLAFPFRAFEVARLGAGGIGRGLKSRDRDRIAYEALARADVTALADRPVQGLSGGEQQRVHFARALAQLEAGRTLVRPEAQILLLDEPLAGLDLKHQIALMDEAVRLAKSGTAVLAILHDLLMAHDYADFVLVLNEGELAAAGRPASVLTADAIEPVFGVRLTVDRLPSSPWVGISAASPDTDARLAR
ncbi:MAG TPA: heme ABC transporter ATP-binding protein [Beijerinckiaceae bacterium]|jgi:iron complex transport system ATP-binding protein